MSSPAWVPMGVDGFTERGWWKLDELNPAAPVVDASGFDHDLALVGGVTCQVDGAKSGSKCVQFDGTSGYAWRAITPALQLAAVWTLAAWVYPTATRGVNTAVCVIVQAYPGSGSVPYVLGYGGEGTEYAIPANSFWAGFYSGTWKSHNGAVLPLNTWTHIAATYDGTWLRLYRNGAEETSKNVGGGNTASGQNFIIGRRWDVLNGANSYFPGRIDDARVWGRVLSAAEILALYQGDLTALLDVPWVPTKE